MSRFIPSPEQQEILDRPLDSMRISAGAGTGKTTTLAYRVARVIRTHGIEPEQVLGITFTNLAAEELAIRVREVLGIDPVRQIEVHTYHGFASSVLAEFGVLVGVERGTQVITPTFARQLIRRVMHNLPYRAFDITTPGAAEIVLRFASNLADHLVPPQGLTPPTEPDEVWLKRLDLIDVVAAYQTEKRRLGVVDFGDLLADANRLVDSHPEVGRLLRERYLAVLLDEYQDTNPAQREFLRKVFGGFTPVMAVGDSDQTIYEWRGASLENFEKFADHFSMPESPAGTLPLTLNRRSGAEILDIANRVRARIDGGFRLPLEPVPGRPPAEVRVARFATAADESDWMADDMIARHHDGAAWSDMAVLFRKNKNMAVVQDSLSRRGVPFEVANLGGLLSIPEVTDLHAWLRLLDRPSDSTALARILLGSRYRLGLADLNALAGWVRTRQHDQPIEMDGEVLFDYSLLEATDHLPEIDLRPEARDLLEQFHGEYRRLLTAAQGVTLVELCRMVLDVTGAWSDIEAMSPAGALSARLNLYRFLDLAESWSPLEGRPSLPAFLDHLDAMEEDTAEELDVARVSESDAVVLVTVHRAKGLEWPIVYLPALIAGTFPAGSRGLEDPFSAPQHLPHEVRIDRDSLPRLTAQMSEKQRKEILRVSHDSQEWRIAYVAVTRARDALVATSAHWYGQPEPTKRPAKPSELFEILAAGRTCDPDCPVAPERPTTQGSRNPGQDLSDPLFDTGWSDALRSALQDPSEPGVMAERLDVADSFQAHRDDFRRTLFELPDPPTPAEGPRIVTSVTGLVTYATCPKQYFWSHVDPLPRRHNPAARRGVDVHRRIELHGLGVVPLADVEEIAYDLPETHGPDTEPSRDPYEVYLTSRFSTTRPTRVEAPFELLMSDGTWVRGRIDAIYGPDSEGRWEIVDFKSGRPRDIPPVQLQAYAVAAVEIGLVPADAPFDVTFVYLGGGKPVEKTYRADADFVDAARDALGRLTEGIRSSAFLPTTGDQCSSCDFLRFCDAGLRLHSE